MTPYEIARQKLRQCPQDLKPADIIAIKARDPWLAKAAVNRCLMARRWAEYQAKYGPMSDAEYRRQRELEVQGSRPRRDYERG